MKVTTPLSPARSMKLTRSPPAATSMRSALPRRALFQTFAAALVTHSLPALAVSYTVVASGSIAERESRLVEVKKLFEQKPEDPYVFGEKAQLEFDIKSLRKNRQYVEQLKGRVQAGQRYLQGVTIPVPDMETAVGFWTGGCRAIVLSTGIIDGRNVTRVGFGPESLNTDDGAKFSLELVETSGVEIGEQSSVVQYIQLAIPVFRISQVIAFGGEIESAYGWTELTAPGGIPLRVQIDDTRRDPFEFVCLRCNDVEKTIKHYEAQGMRVQQREGKRKLAKGTSNSNSIFERTSAFEPERDKGSVLLGFDDQELSTGLLLSPPKSRQKLSVPKVARLTVVGPAPDASLEASPDGLRSVFVDGASFEKSLAA